MDQMEGFLLLWGEHHFHHFSLGNPRLGWVTFVTPDVNHGFLPADLPADSGSLDLVVVT